MVVRISPPSRARVKKTAGPLEPPHLRYLPPCFPRCHRFHAWPASRMVHPATLASAGMSRNTECSLLPLDLCVPSETAAPLALQFLNPASPWHCVF